MLLCAQAPAVVHLQQTRTAPAASSAPVTFTEVSPRESGITWVHNNAMSPQRYLPETVGAGCVFFDYDNDRWMDIYLVDSGPSDFYRPPTPLKSALYHNNGDGTFTDVSKESGIADSPGKAFGAVATDVNNDGRLDLFVANDTMPNFLFINKGHGKFEEVGLSAGVAYSEAGSPRSGMGVDATDYDGDGWQDLFVANIDQELFSLYHNEKDLTFVDKPGEIAPATRLMSGWGLKFFDYDNDGTPDLFLANGHPDDMVETLTTRVKYKEPLLVFQNTGGMFKDVSAQSGAAFSKSYPAR